MRRETITISATTPPLMIPARAPGDKESCGLVSCSSSAGGVAPGFPVGPLPLLLLLLLFGPVLDVDVDVGWVEDGGKVKEGSVVRVVGKDSNGTGGTSGATGAGSLPVLPAVSGTDWRLWMWMWA